MYAVLESGGKQHKVREGDLLRVEKIEGEIGADLTLEEILMIANDGDIKLGAPTIDGAKITAEIVKHGLGKKILVFKRKRTKNYRRMRGHRQPYTDIRIKKIEVN